MSLEENFLKIEETINKLSGDDVTLEDAFKAYSEGMELLKKCNDELDKVEKKVIVLSGEEQ